MTQLTKNTVPPPQECGVLFSNSSFFATRTPTQPAETQQNHSLHVCKRNSGDRDVRAMAKLIDFLMDEHESSSETESNNTT